MYLGTATDFLKPNHPVHEEWERAHHFHSGGLAFNETLPIYRPWIGISRNLGGPSRRTGAQETLTRLRGHRKATAAPMRLA